MPRRVSCSSASISLLGLAHLDSPGRAAGARSSGRTGKRPVALEPPAMSKVAIGSILCRSSGRDLAALSFCRRMLAAAAFVLTSSDAGIGQTIDGNLWVTDRIVRAVVRDGGTVYIGGDFTQVGPATGGFVPLDATTGAPPPSFPRVTGRVLAVISDGAGGWYLGGGFSAVGGVPRSSLAHVGSDLSVAAWNPNANGEVKALAVSGSMVYAGGQFTSVGGQTRFSLAALDSATGAATTWNPSPGGGVSALAVSDSTVYAAGNFTAIGGLPQSYIAAMGDLATPALLSLVSARAAPDLVVLDWYAPARDVRARPFTAAPRAADGRPWAGSGPTAPGGSSTKTGGWRLARATATGSG